MQRFESLVLRVAALVSMPTLACSSEPTTAAVLEPAAPDRDQRVDLELARVPEALAKPVIAELGLSATGLIAVRHRIDPEWHIYWRNPGGSGLPTKLTATPSQGSTLELGPAIYPAPDRFEDSFGWEHEAILFLPILAGEGGVAIHSDWVACQSEACVSGENDATLEPGAEAPADDPVLLAMLDRIPRPLGDRVTKHAWSKTDDRVTLELTLAGDARTIELFPDASDPALFFGETRWDPEGRILTIDWRVGTPGHPLPAGQGVLAWTDDTRTRYHELGLPWPE
jgi:DsbC/DsbD-like thiol-disulfide interchange protein